MRRGDRSRAVEHVLIQFAQEAVTGSTPRGRLSAAFIVVAVLAMLGPDRVARGPRLCLISAIIRRPCPGCGMTRAAAALLRGNLRRATRTNPRIIPVAVIGLSILLCDARTILAHRGSDVNQQRQTA